MPKQYANFDFELTLLRDRYDYIIAIDEVGRGAIAGPVVVGATVVNIDNQAGIPEGLRDSKLIPEKQRDDYHDKVLGWVLAGSVGSVEASYIDSYGITHSLAQAAQQAIFKLESAVPDIKEKRTIVLLDGSHNWLKELNLPYFTITKVKADLECASVSGASVLAKVFRDNLMVEASLELEDKYGWKSNKGYGAKTHYDAISEFGLVDNWHRKTWIK